MMLDSVVWERFDVVRFGEHKTTKQKKTRTPFAIAESLREVAHVGCSSNTELQVECYRYIHSRHLELCTICYLE